MLSKESVEQLIKEISGELKDFEFRKDLLSKFHLHKKEDAIFWGYLHGEGVSDYIKFLSILMTKLQPKHVVELGNREGLSTIGLYQGISTYGGKFTTIDLVDDLRYCPDSLKKDKHVQILNGDVCNLNIFGEDLPMDIDFLFSDTVHYYDQVLSEFEIYQHLLSDVALVAIDDINVNDKRKFFDEVTYPKWDLTELCHVSGWGLFLFERKEKLSKEERKEKALYAAIQVYCNQYWKLFQKTETLEANQPLNRIKSFIKKCPILYNKLLPVYLYFYKKYSNLKK